MSSAYLGFFLLDLQVPKNKLQLVGITAYLVRPLSSNLYSHHDNHIHPHISFLPSDCIIH